MSDSDTLLAYLVPRLTSRVEDTATDALAFILNKSETCRRAFNDLLGTDGAELEPVVRFLTQVGYDGGKSRPDMVGYRTDGKAHLLVESKFWAGLQPDQAHRYLEQMDPTIPGVLLFICPERRVEHLWREVRSQIEDGRDRVELERVEVRDGIRQAVVAGRDVRLILCSWNLLLTRLNEAADGSDVRSDLDQLRGLARHENEKGFLPLTPDASAPDFKLRDEHFRKLIRQVVERGKSEKWLSTKGFTWGNAKTHGGGDLYVRRYFGVADARPVWMALGVEYQKDLFEITPIWIWVPLRFWLYDEIPNGAVKAQEHLWLPLHLKADVVFEEVVDDLVTQVRMTTEWFHPEESDSRRPFGLEAT